MSPVLTMLLLPDFRKVFAPKLLKKDHAFSFYLLNHCGDLLFKPNAKPSKLSKISLSTSRFILWNCEEYPENMF